MKPEDFVFDHIEEEYEDYWFEVRGETQDELTHKYMKMCMIAVTHVVYSCKENIVGIKQLFPFNSCVAISDWDELNDMVKSIVQEMKGDSISKFLESV